jgi:hypothetical protein
MFPETDDRYHPPPERQKRDPLVVSPPAFQKLTLLWLGQNYHDLAPMRQGTTPGFESALPPVLHDNALVISLIPVTFRTRD